MKKTLCIIFLIGICAHVQAQTAVPFQKDNILLDGSIGFPNLLQFEERWQDLDPSKTPVLQLALGKGLTDEFSVSLFFAYGRLSVNQTLTDEIGQYTVNVRSNTTIFGLKGQYHLYKKLHTNANADPYMSVGMGMRTDKEDAMVNLYGMGNIQSNTKSTNAFFMVHAGVRYWLGKTTSIYGEVGYGAAVFNTGLSFRF
jgi:hypothetical protein